MKFKSLDEIEAAGYTGESGNKLYRIDTIVFDTYIEDDGGEYVMDAEFWYDEENEVWTHPFDCFFTDLAEAREYAAGFTVDMARWAHEHGNGRKFCHVAIDVMEMEWSGTSLYCGSMAYGPLFTSYDWEPGYVVTTHDWKWAVEHEEWNDGEVAANHRDCKM